MPQMMPLNWWILFSLFSMLLLLFNMMNYYISYNKLSMKLYTKINHNILYWKW